MNTDVMENIKADVVISFGPNCRAADAIKRNNLRFFSSPFDWVMKYKLDDVYNILKNKGKDFFADFEEGDCSKGTKFRYIISKSTGMVAMHHFYQHIRIDEAYFLFKHTMTRRFNKLDKLLSDAKNICIVTSRKSETEDIISFIDNFSNLYEFENIYFINIYDDEKEDIIETKYKNSTIYQCYFKDVHPDGSDSAKNKKFWKGNMELWDAILSKVRLNEEFKNNHKERRFNKKISDFNLKTYLKVLFLNYKYSILRYINIIFRRKQKN